MQGPDGYEECSDAGMKLLAFCQPFWKEIFAQVDMVAPFGTKSHCTDFGNRTHQGEKWCSDGTVLLFAWQDTNHQLLCRSSRRQSSYKRIPSASGA